ncbi:hypothetical protein LJK87_01245 [Paenibacillus sp. P25]|nr:hypothetical protein LJK87_01245 [Paenibacillus sp. P25]
MERLPSEPTEAPPGGLYPDVRLSIFCTVGSHAPLITRQEGQDPEAKRIAWKAQHRLHKKYQQITSRGSAGKKAAVAVAMERMGFIWAIGCEIEKKQSETNAAT